MTGTQKKKITPKPKRKMRQRPKVAPKVRKVKKVKEKIPQNEAEEIFKKRDKMQCVGPVNPIKNLTASFDGSWGVIIDAIDAALKQSAVQFPNLFSIDIDSTGANTSPTVQFSHARSLWICIVQWWLWHAGVITSVDADFAAFVPPSKKLPQSVAKIVQQFLPYHDPATGATFRTTMSQFPVVDIYWDYASVDKRSDIITNSASTPFKYALSHPSKFVSGTSLIDYAIKDYETSGQVLGVTSNIFTNVLSMSNEEVTYIDSLLTSVDVTEVDKCAPDGSIYCVVDLQGITCPVPNFDPGMAVLLSRVEATADTATNHPFIKAMPAARLNVNIDSTTITGASYDQRRLLMLNAYTYMIIHGKQWHDGPWPQLLNGSPYRGVRNLNLMFTEVSAELIGDAIAQLYPLIVNISATSSSAAARRYWAFSLMHWGVIMRRFHKFDVIIDAAGKVGSDFPNRYNGYTAAATFDKFQIAASLQPLMASTGPVVSNGSLYIPYFKDDVGSMLNSISNTGTWTPVETGSDPVTMGVGSSAYTGSTSITWVDGSPITYDNTFRYGKCFYALSSFLAGIFQEIKEMPYAQGLSPPINPDGDPNFILGPVIIEKEKAFAQASQSAINGWYPAFRYNRTGSTPRICTPGGSFALAVSFSCIKNVVQDLPYPCRMPIDLQTFQPFYLTQIDITGTAGSTEFAATRQAFNESLNIPKTTPKISREGVAGASVMQDRTVSLSRAFIESSGRIAQPVKHHSHHHGFLTQLSHLVGDVGKIISHPNTKNMLKLTKDVIHGTSALGGEIYHVVPKVMRLVQKGAFKNPLSLASSVAPMLPLLAVA